jgi:hypothetical protein
MRPAGNLLRVTDKLSLASARFEKQAFEADDGQAIAGDLWLRAIAMFAQIIYCILLYSSRETLQR